MEQEILKKLLQESKFFEKVIIKIFPNLFIKAYNIGRIACFNVLQESNPEK